MNFCILIMLLLSLITKGCNNMPIERTELSGKGVEAGMAFCRDCYEGKGRTLAYFHRGYGDNAEPLADDELDTIASITAQHEANTKHKINVILYHI